MSTQFYTRLNMFLFLKF